MREIDTSTLGKKQIAITSFNNKNGTVSVALITLDKVGQTK